MGRTVKIHKYIDTYVQYLSKFINTLIHMYSTCIRHVLDFMRRLQSKS